MIGAIAGDIIGSVYEGKKHWMTARTADFQPLFSPGARFTDDTVLTVAVADSLLHGTDLVESLKDYYARYPGAGFGGDFKRWAASDEFEPYGSWGNGSAMRVSPVAWAFTTLDEVIHRAKETARVTHNHPEGVKGAQATAAAIYLARCKTEKWAIQAEIERRFQYDLSFTLDDIRPTYNFDSSCRGTVPHAIVAFPEATDYKSAVRLAISLGGDCDTLACLAGSIAAAYYGIQDEIRGRAMAHLDEPLLQVVADFERLYPEAICRMPDIDQGGHEIQLSYNNDMKKILTTPEVDFAIRTLGSEERLQVHAWSNHLANWDNDADLREIAHALPGIPETFVLPTNSDLRIFFKVADDTITILDIAKRQTILITAGLSAKE